MKMTKLIPSMLDPRFNRRLHDVADLLFSMFFQVGGCVKTLAGASDYAIDSFPVAVCDNIRLSRSRMVKGKQWRGKQASMRRYFYGVKVQVLVTAQGIPVEFCFVPGSESDVQALRKLPLSVAAESRIYGDAAYTDYKIEDDMKEVEGIELMIARRSNAKRKDEPWITFLKEQRRKRIETTFSQIKALFLRTIHAFTFRGFLLKLILFIFVFTLDKLS